MYKPARVGLIFAILTVMMSIYVSALYRFQIYDTRPAEEAASAVRISSRSVTLPAARGNIYDRNGVLLASGRPSYNITLNRIALLRSPNMNEKVLELIYTTMDRGLSYVDTFPVTRGAPFGYVTDMSRTQRSRLDAYFEYFGLDPAISASDLLAWMRGNYGIDYTVGILDARLIIGVRYELEIRAIVGNISPYVFARDIGSEFVTHIKELGMTGVHIESGYIREYNTTNAAHILGYIGRMSPVQYEFFRELGYPMDAMVGKTGAELAFESMLHGVDGRQIIRSTDDGTVTDIVTLREPEPGSHVYLTIDLALQAVVEQAMSAQIGVINNQREEEGDRITGGAVVVTDVRTGEILAAASFPTFNPMLLTQDWAMLNSDPMRPMFNRATQGRYSPGSTFKMVTAFAGLRHGVIGRYTEIDDVGRYSAYSDFQPSCWLFSLGGVGHGRLNVVQALEVSCNYFFCAVADWLEGGWKPGAEALAAAAQEFGLGINTGLEIPENPGRLATPDVKMEVMNEDWWRADNVVTGFGQGLNRFTPVQLANYAATIANGGTLHSLSILRRVASSDFSERLYTHEPVVLNVIEETEYVQILQEGMRAVSRGGRGTARAVFSDYQPRVASKTGTVQVEGRDINDGVFVCYAPADNPEIAISIVIEKGGSGSAVMDIARVIFDHYFRTEQTLLAAPFGELIP